MEDYEARLIQSAIPLLTPAPRDMGTRLTFRTEIAKEFKKLARKEKKSTTGLLILCMNAYLNVGRQLVAKPKLDYLELAIINSIRLCGVYSSKDVDITDLKSGHDAYKICKTFPIFFNTLHVYTSSTEEKTCSFTSFLKDIEKYIKERKLQKQVKIKWTPELVLQELKNQQ